MLPLASDLGSVEFALHKTSFWGCATNGADRAKQDGTLRQLAHVKVSIRLYVVFARDRTPQSHLFADEFPEFFRAAQRERHLLCLIELLGDVRSTGSD